MKLLIDIDNTLTTSLPTMKEYCKRYNDEVVGRGLQMNPRGFNESTLYDWTNDEKQTFCDRYLEEIVLKVPVKERAAKITGQLRADGHYLYIVSARKKPHFSDPFTLTDGYLKKNQIAYDELVVGCEDKLAFCIEHGIDIAMDDEPQNILPISEIMPVVVFKGMQNDHCRGGNIIKVDDWTEAYRAVKLHERGFKFYPGMDMKQVGLLELKAPKKSGLADVLGDVDMRRGQLDNAVNYVKEQVQGNSEQDIEVQEEK